MRFVALLIILPILGGMFWLAAAMLETPFPL
jgi:hypothetical protein